VQGDEAVDRTFVASLPDADLQNALAHLDVSHRAVVVLRYLMDWSVEDVAATLNIPEGTVKSRLKRALEKLRTEMT
jgi:RNA polymerase sigma factor (sigma-70 family)